MMKTIWTLCTYMLCRNSPLYIQWPLLVVWLYVHRRFVAKLSYLKTHNRFALNPRNIWTGISPVGFNTWCNMTVGDDLPKACHMGFLLHDTEGRESLTACHFRTFTVSRRLCQHNWKLRPTLIKITYDSHISKRLFKLSHWYFMNKPVWFFTVVYMELYHICIYCLRVICCKPIYCWFFASMEVSKMWASRNSLSHVI